MKLSEKHAYWALSALGTLTPRRAHELINFFGSASELWRTPISDWPISYIPKSISGKISLLQHEFDPHSWHSIMSDNGITMLTFSEANYPEKLRNLHDPPLVIYYKGNLDTDSQKSYLAVVGSRKRKSYGMKVINDLLPSLIHSGLNIVSGMAQGIDTDAHKCSLDNDGYTIAVLGSGLNQPYPKHNYNLMTRIIQSGAVIGEYPPDFEARKWTFPARNRIIAALSDAVLVVEAGEKSGALITADYATQLGKDVFAVPGNITSSTSMGTNMLIQNGAKLIMSADDIAEEFANLCKSNDRNMTIFEFQSEIEQKIYSILDNEPLSVDEIIKKIGGAASEILATLTMMSLRGVVNEFPGRLFSR